MILNDNTIKKKLRLHVCTEIAYTLRRFDSYLKYIIFEF